MDLHYGYERGLEMGILYRLPDICDEFEKAVSIGWRCVALRMTRCPDFDASRLQLIRRGQKVINDLMLEYSQL